MNYILRQVDRKNIQAKIIILCVMACLLCLASCKQQADVNKLFNGSETDVELEFEYVHIPQGNYSGMADGKLYHVRYDKISGMFHVWSGRFAYIEIDEVYSMRINKFQCTDTQICFQNDEARIVIENADTYYIVHLYIKSVSGLDVSWENDMTFFNSSSVPYDLNKKFRTQKDDVDSQNVEVEKGVEQKDDDISSANSDSAYDPDEIEDKAQNFLAHYRKESRYKALLGYPKEDEVVRLFPVSIVSEPDESGTMLISFSKYDFDGKTEELGITEGLPISGCYVVYKEQLYDCRDLEVNDFGTAQYVCRPHEVWTDI